MKLNKKGFSSISLVITILIISIFVIFTVMGIFGYLFHKITDSLDINLMAGNVNISNVTQSTIGVIDTAIANNMNLYALMIIFGGIIGLFASAYLTRDKNPKLFVVFDLILVYIMYIVSVYVSNYYQIVTGITETASVFTGEMSFAQIFMLKLPLISVVVGFIGIAITYLGLPKTTGEVNYESINQGFQ